MRLGINITESIKLYWSKIYWRALSLVLKDCRLWQVLIEGTTE